MQEKKRFLLEEVKEAEEEKKTSKLSYYDSQSVNRLPSNFG